MAWIEITESDLLTVMSGPELEAVRGAALAIDQSDPVQPTIHQVTDLVRGYIDASGRYLLGDTGIPQKLLAPALDIIAYRLPNRVQIGATDARKDLHDRAIQLLEQVAKGSYGIEEPLIPTTEVSSSASPSIHRRRRQFTRRKQDGL